jgi:hypothetical protein
MTSFKELLYNGYNNRQKQDNDLASKGYQKVKSDSNSQIFYNPQNETLIDNINGSRSIRDWKDNFVYAISGNVNDDRYKQEKNDLEKARKEYKPKKTIISGHSRGGLLARAISEPQDQIITHNAPSHFFKDKPKSNEKAYRNNSDVISILSARNKNTKTLPQNYIPTNSFNSTYNLVSNSLKAHKTNTLNKNIGIGI